MHFCGDELTALAGAVPFMAVLCAKCRQLWNWMCCRGS